MVLQIVRGVGEISAMAWACSESPMELIWAFTTIMLAALTRFERGATALGSLGGTMVITFSLMRFFQISLIRVHVTASGILLKRHPILAVVAELRAVHPCRMSAGLCPREGVPLTVRTALERLLTEVG
jgi:hypothetical protein